MKSKLERIEDAISHYETEVMINDSEHSGYEEPRESVLALEGLKLLHKKETRKERKSYTTFYDIKEYLDNTYVRLRDGNIGYCVDGVISLKSSKNIRLSQYRGLNYNRSRSPFQEYGNRDLDIIDIWKINNPSYFHYRLENLDIEIIKRECSLIFTKDNDIIEKEI